MVCSGGLVISFLVYLQCVSATSFNSRNENLTEVPTDLIAWNARSVSITHNLLTYVGPNTFINFRLLSTIDLSYNRISALSDTAFNGTILSRLTIQNNRLTTLPNFASVGRTLKYISANHNAIERLNNNPFRGVSGLTTISLQYNGMRTISPDALSSGATNLTRFDLGQNLIDSIPAELFRSTGLLNSMNLQNNRLTSFLDFRFLPEQNSITSLSMNQNRCGDLSPGALHKLTKLRNLAMANNGLTQWPDFSRQRNTMTSIYLGGNRITEIPGDAFIGMPLRILNLQGNRFVGMPNLLPLNSTLTNLYIGSNQFGPVSCEAMLHFLNASTNLRFFDLSNVGLVTFPDIFQLNRDIRYARFLNSRTMHCDCAMDWMRQVPQRIPSTDVTAGSRPCASPGQLTGKMLANITRDDFCRDNDAQSCRLPEVSSPTSVSSEPTLHTTHFTSPTSQPPTTPNLQFTSDSTTTDVRIKSTGLSEFISTSAEYEQTDSTFHHNGSGKKNGVPLSVILGCCLGGLLLIAVIAIVFMARRMLRAANTTVSDLYTSPRLDKTSGTNEYGVSPVSGVYEEINLNTKAPNPPPPRHLKPSDDGTYLNPVDLDYYDDIGHLPCEGNQEGDTYENADATYQQIDSIESM